MNIMACTFLRNYWHGVVFAGKGGLAEQGLGLGLGGGC